MQIMITKKIQHFNDLIEIDLTLLGSIPDKRFFSLVQVFSEQASFSWELQSGCQDKFSEDEDHDNQESITAIRIAPTGISGNTVQLQETSPHHSRRLLGTCMMNQCHASVSPCLRAFTLPCFHDT
ncbi:hypothetical protein N7466_006806 [Penicillium verhagenii]|uniref:uncharacterized protein n=1 Tax=Penicillium verhagenii TaxID=1562060 RepID=UPI0025456EDA|nr:uncharacterized protein N7466_006806 [Penicillium verhagenii]KAJ5927850.1 hypothetical protein N7466_006806 [Penicillium verhagenii]